MTKRVSICSVLLCIALALPASVDFAAGQRAYDKGDYTTALNEWKPLAAKGNAAAQYNVGMMCYQGRGVAQDYAEAAHWLRKAAEQGDVNAQHHLGFMYDQGRGVAQDYAEAVRWYRKAAEQGHGAAQLRLGVMYYLGQGAAKDYVQAHMWLSFAGSRTTGDRQDGFANILDFVARKMTPAQIAEAQALARKWNPKTKP